MLTNHLSCQININSYTTLLQAVDLYGPMRLPLSLHSDSMMQYLSLMTASSRRWIHCKKFVLQACYLCRQVMKDSLPAGTGLADTGLPMAPSPLN